MEKLRPLSIPTMYDRAQQALYKQGLAPVAETTADKNSYGFREGRACADAVASAFNALSKPNSALWILERDIKGCFDNISFEWILKNIPMDKAVLLKWLKVGYVENGIHYPTRKGVPQGGIISPTIANMVLDGLEEALRSAVPRRRRINFVPYTDDFIPVVEGFLAIKIRNEYEGNEDFEKIFQAFKKQYYNTSRFTKEGNKITLIFEECTCPLVKEGVNNSYLCNCTIGYSLKIFETLCDKPVKVKLLKSILNGDNICKQEILIKDV